MNPDSAESEQQKTFYEEKAPEYWLQWLLSFFIPCGLIALCIPPSVPWLVVLASGITAGLVGSAFFLHQAKKAQTWPYLTDKTIKTHKEKQEEELFRKAYTPLEDLKTAFQQTSCIFQYHARAFEQEKKEALLNEENKNKVLEARPKEAFDYHSLKPMHHYPLDP